MILNEMKCSGTDWKRFSTCWQLSPTLIQNIEILENVSPRLQLELNTKNGTLHEQSHKWTGNKLYPDINLVKLYFQFLTANFRLNAPGMSKAEVQASCTMLVHKSKFAKFGIKFVVVLL